jgi:hypothetical protein
MMKIQTHGFARFEKKNILRVIFRRLSRAFIMIQNHEHLS